MKKILSCAITLIALLPLIASGALAVGRAAPVKVVPRSILLVRPGVSVRSMRVSLPSFLGVSPPRGSIRAFDKAAAPLLGQGSVAAIALNDNPALLPLNEDSGGLPAPGAVLPPAPIPGAVPGTPAFVGPAAPETEVEHADARTLISGNKVLASAMTREQGSEDAVVKPGDVLFDNAQKRRNEGSDAVAGRALGFGGNGLQPFSVKSLAAKISPAAAVLGFSNTAMAADAVRRIPFDTVQHIPFHAPALLAVSIAAAFMSVSLLVDSHDAFLDVKSFRLWSAMNSVAIPIAALGLALGALPAPLAMLAMGIFAAMGLASAVYHLAGDKTVRSLEVSAGISWIGLGASAAPFIFISAPGMALLAFGVFLNSSLFGLALLRNRKR